MRSVRSLRTDANLRRTIVVGAVLAIVVALGWLTGTLASENATEDSLLADTSVVRVVAPGGASCGAHERMVSVVVDQLGETVDPNSYPILGLQGWSFVLHYDPAVLRFMRDAGSVSVPVGPENRRWELLPANVDADRGTVEIRVSSEARNQQLPRAGAIRPESGHPLILGSVVFAPIGAGYSQISVDDVTLIPAGASTPLPPPAVTDTVVATSCP